MRTILLNTQLVPVLETRLQQFNNFAHFIQFVTTMLLIFLILIIIGILFYQCLIKPQLYWKSKHVKQGYPVPLFGDNLKTTFKIESMTELTKRLYNQYKNERYFGIYQTTLPTLVIRDPALIKQMTVKDFEHFVDHQNFAANSAEPIWNNNLFSLTGDKWRQMRATLSPTFTSSKMRLMFELMETSAQQYIDFYLAQNKDMIVIELKDSFTRFANDVIANCAFGVAVDSLKEPTNSFYMNGKEITNFTSFRKSIKFILTLMLPKFAAFLGLELFSPETTQFFRTLVHDTVKLREEQNIVRPDMINLLMEARNGQLKYEESHVHNEAGFATVEESHVGLTQHLAQPPLTEEDIAAQVFIFFFAGFETISTMMNFMCYELAVNPDIQENLIREVDETLVKCKGRLTYDALNKMKYMDMVTSESLRKHPPVPFLNRICTKSYTIQPEKQGEYPVQLDNGQAIMFPAIGIHHDESLYPDPEKFDPERFSDENKDNINPYTFIPFGQGPRNCIGSRFALMEAKTLIFHILSKFEIAVVEKTPIPLKYDTRQFNPAIEGGCWVGFKRRADKL